MKIASPGAVSLLSPEKADVRVGRGSALVGRHPSWGSIAEVLQALKLHVAPVQAPLDVLLQQHGSTQAAEGQVLPGAAFYPVLVRGTSPFAPCLLPTLGHPHAVALCVAHCDHLPAGLAPAGVRPYWAHQEKSPRHAGGFMLTVKPLVLSRRFRSE
jgi:hypothetical protein